MKEKKSFLVLKDTLNSALAMLTKEQAGELIFAINAYQNGEDYSITSPVVSMAMQFFIKDFEHEMERYEEVCERRREAVNKRWKNNAEQIQMYTIDTNGNTNTSENTNVNSSPIVEEVKENKKEKSSRFVKPSLEEVVQYFAEKYGNPQEAERFFNYYESNGWKVGKNAMKNWHSAAANWMSNVTNNQKPQQNGYTTRFDRITHEYEQLGQALAQQSARRFADEAAARSGETTSRFVPPPL